MDDWMIFKIDLQEGGWESLTRLIWLRIEQVGGSCECSNEPVGYGLCHSNSSGKMYSSVIGLCIFSKCTMYKQTLLMMNYYLFETCRGYFN